MSRKTVALDLETSNLLWLQARALASGHRSLSEILNDVLAKARSAGAESEAKEIKSVVGRARIHEDDPDLAEADAAIRALFLESHERFLPLNELLFFGMKCRF